MFFIKKTINIIENKIIYKLVEENTVFKSSISKKIKFTDTLFSVNKTLINGINIPILKTSKVAAISIKKNIITIDFFSLKLRILYSLDTKTVILFYFFFK